MNSSRVFSISLALALCLVGGVDLYAIFRVVNETGEGAIKEFAIFHLGAVLAGVFLVLVFRGGGTLANFSGLVGFLVPVAGFFATALFLFFIRRGETVKSIEQPFIVGNPSRYRTAPDSPGQPIEAGTDEGRLATLRLRHVESREAVLNLQRMRSEPDPFTSLYASGALETQMGYMENRISQLRNQVKTFPEDLRGKRLLAEALINQLGLIDPKVETGEGSKTMKEAESILASLGISSAKLELMMAMRAADQLIHKGDWESVIEKLGGEVPLAVAGFWSGKSPGQSSSFIS